MESSIPYRPMSAAARAAALRAKMAGVGVKVPAAPGLSAIGGGSSTYLAALDKLTATTQKWLENLDQLTENALKNQKKLKPEDSASSDERDADSAKSVGSNDRIRPGTPPNMPNLERVEASTREPASRNPLPTPTLKIEDMEIRSPESASNPSNLNEVMNVDPSPSSALPKVEASTPEPLFKSPLFRPPVTAHTSIASIPPTPPTVLTPSLLTPTEIPIIKEPTPISPATGPSSLLTPDSESSATLAPSENTLSVKTESVSTSSSKKRRLSSKTILESLMEKKSRHPIWYDGVAQKSFYDMVFEMSQQIQSMKREKRIVMFAKDPACGNLLDTLDNLLQKSLKTIEFSSFLFLKGKPDIKEIENLKGDLKKSLESIEEFKKSGWTMANDDDDSDSENDEEDEDED